MQEPSNFHRSLFHWLSYTVNFLSRDIDIANLSVCLSVRPWRSGIRWKRLNISSFSPYASPIILGLPPSHIFKNSDGVTACGGAKCRWSMKISRFSTNKSLYLANDTKYRHGCHGGQIGNRTQPFEWHQFQWHWVTYNPDFKVTILFNVK